MKQLITSWLLGVLCLSLSPGLVMANSIQQAFDQRESYANKLQLGNPDIDGSKSFLNKDADVSSFTNLGDQDLTNKGANELNNSEVGQLLQQAEIGKLNASSEHQINTDNAMLKNSLKIESDPLKETGGDNYLVSESVSKVTISKSCLDGVDFEVDVLRQLIVNNELTSKLGPWQDQMMTVDLAPLLNPILAEMGLHQEIEYYKKTGRHAAYPINGRQPAIIPAVKRMLAQRLGLANPNVSANEQIDISTGNFNFDATTFTAGGNHNSWKGQVGWLTRVAMGSNLYNVRYKYREKITGFKEKEEYWQVVNEAQEALVESSDCHVMQRKCLETGNKVFFEKFTVNRPCWKEQITYVCSSEPVNGCKHLTNQGCLLKNSKCNKQVAIQGSSTGNSNICLQWLRNYQCYSEKKELRSSLKNAPMFCLGGDCHTTTIMPNDDIHLVGYLAMLNEIRKDMQTNPIKVFKGEVNNCDHCVASYIDCCSSMKGWGKDLSLSRCSGQEKALALKKSKGLCHYIGTYCSKKVLGKCVTKKSTYCCFNSKLSRIFQQQGRQQLGLSFGSSQTPNCRGLTTDELQRIDFSKFDLEELFADLITNAKSKMLKVFPNQTSDQMPVLQKQIPVNSKNHNPNLSY